MVCFYVHPDAKRQGVASALLAAAEALAAAHGARLVEAYPVGPKQINLDAYTGYAPMYDAAGYETVRRSGRRKQVAPQPSGLGQEPMRPVGVRPERVERRQEGGQHRAHLAGVAATSDHDLARDRRHVGDGHRHQPPRPDLGLHARAGQQGDPSRCSTMRLAASMLSTSSRPRGEMPACRTMALVSS